MDSFEEKAQAKLTELLGNLNSFVEKENNSAGTRARKNAQEMKSLLQSMRVEILETQKKRKGKKKG